MDDVAVFVLAGGKSTRMGTDKAFLTFRGQTLLERALQVGRGIAADVRIVGDVQKFRAFAPVIEDVFPGHGPLGGIHVALTSSDKESNLVIAVDLPFLSPELLHFIIEKARRAGTSVTVPHAGGALQPLCAVYRKAFAEVADKALQAGKNKIDPLFTLVTTTVVSEPELSAAGFSAELFRNLNTPDDLAEATEKR